MQLSSDKKQSKHKTTWDDEKKYRMSGDDKILSSEPNYPLRPYVFLLMKVTVTDAYELNGRMN